MWVVRFSGYGAKRLDRLHSKRLNLLPAMMCKGRRNNRLCLVLGVMPDLRQPPPPSQKRVLLAVETCVVRGSVILAAPENTAVVRLVRGEREKRTTPAAKQITDTAHEVGYDVYCLRIARVIIYRRVTALSYRVRRATVCPPIGSCPPPPPYHPPNSRRF